MAKDARARIDAGRAYQALRKLSALPLPAKIKRAKRIIRAALDTGAVVVAFSGGRDSTALAHLARTIAPKIPLAFISTGLARDALVAWVREFGGDHLVEIHPPADPETTWREKPYLPIGAKISARYYRKDNPELRICGESCCRVHKAQPMDRFLKANNVAAILNGARGDESNRHRFKLQTGEIFRAKNGRWLAYPLLTWKRADSFEYTAANVPAYPLVYGRGLELGCQCCATDLAAWPNTLAHLRKDDPAAYRHYIVDCGFGRQILMLKFGLTGKAADALIERETWAGLIACGALDKIPHPRKGHR